MPYGIHTIDFSEQFVFALHTEKEASVEENESAS